MVFAVTFEDFFFNFLHLNSIFYLCSLFEYWNFILDPVIVNLDQITSVKLKNGEFDIGQFFTVWFDGANQI